MVAAQANPAVRDCLCVTFLAGSVNGSVNDIDKYDCFISHSSKDMTNAMSLVERLESRGVNCWVAPRDIDAGANYSDEIVEGIRTSASLIVLISKDFSEQSPCTKRS